jgi:hypothetical protein
MSSGIVARPVAERGVERGERARARARERERERERERKGGRGKSMWHVLLNQ